MTKNESEKLQHIRAHLPWYVNGTLDMENTREVERAVSSSPELQAEVDWLKSVQHKMHEEGEQVADDIGLERFNALIANEKKGNVTSIMPSQWQQWQRPLMAIAATVMVVQMGVIGTLLQNKPDQSLTTLSGSTAPAADGAMLLQVVFSETATAANIRQSLNQINGEIVAGPGAMGIYTVQVSTKNSADSISQLRKQPGVESVTQITE